MKYEVVVNITPVFLVTTYVLVPLHFVVMPEVIIILVVIVFVSVPLHITIKSNNRS